MQLQHGLLTCPGTSTFSILSLHVQVIVIHSTFSDNTVVAGHKHCQCSVSVLEVELRDVVVDAVVDFVLHVCTQSGLAEASPMVRAALNSYEISKQTPRTGTQAIGSAVDVSNCAVLLH